MTPPRTVAGATATACVGAAVGTGIGSVVGNGVSRGAGEVADAVGGGATVTSGSGVAVKVGISPRTNKVAVGDAPATLSLAPPAWRVNLQATPSNNTTTKSRNNGNCFITLVRLVRHHLHTRQRNDRRMCKRSIAINVHSVRKRACL